MIQLSIPGRGLVQLEHLVLDVNGTLALDGRLLDKVVKPVTALRDRLEVHLLTANTFGAQDGIDARLGLRATRLTPGSETEQKAEVVRRLGPDRVVAIGQGANDAGMLRAAAIGIAVMGGEGLSAEALQAADVLALSIFDALDLIEHPTRLVATLRK